MWRARGFEADEGYPRKMRRTREIPVINIISKESAVRPNYVLCDYFLVRIDVLFAFHLNTVCMSRKSPKFVCVIDPFRRQLGEVLSGANCTEGAGACQT